MPVLQTISRLAVPLTFLSLELAELRKQFEADKERIEQMKSARQFRPFK